MSYSALFTVYKGCGNGQTIIYTDSIDYRFVITFLWEKYNKTSIKMLILININVSCCYFFVNRKSHSKIRHVTSKKIRETREGVEKKTPKTRWIITHFYDVTYLIFEWISPFTFLQLNYFFFFWGGGEDTSHILTIFLVVTYFFGQFIYYWGTCPLPPKTS